MVGLKTLGLVLLLCAPSHGTTVSPAFESQQQSRWSWAAVTAGVLEHVRGSAPRQCQLASRFHGHGDEYCCPPHRQTHARCNRGFPVFRALDQLGVLAERLPGPISARALGEETQSGSPVPLRIRWWTGQSHYLLVTHAEGETVTVWDPSPEGGTQELSWADLRKYRGGLWVETYLTR